VSFCAKDLLRGADFFFLEGFKEMTLAGNSWKFEIFMRRLLAKMRIIKKELCKLSKGNGEGWDDVMTVKFFLSAFKFFYF
jgi:hypothetical protein